PVLNFFFTESRLKHPPGPDVVVTPRAKRIGGAILAVIVLALLEFVARRRMKVEMTIGEYDPYLQNALAPGTNLHVNGLGFRGEEIVPEKELGALRIFYLGGSTFLGASVTFEETHPRLLEKRLRQQFPGRRIEVQNAANHWHTTEHSLMKYLFKIRDFRPDLVIVCHNINDLYRSFSPPEFARPGYERDYSHFYGPVSRMVQTYFQRPPVVRVHLQCFRRLSELFGPRLFSDFRRLKETDRADLASRDSFRRNLAMLVRVLKQDGVRVVLATEPSLYRHDLTAEEEKKLWMNKQFCVVGPRTYLGAGAMADGMAEFNAIIKEVAREEGAPLVDLDAVLPRTLEYFRDDCHYNEKGHALVAKALGDFILENRLADDSAQ
nr:SGNH/GDSL hydrolase family protein [Kiritimatiellia bacterium]